MSTNPPKQNQISQNGMIILTGIGLLFLVVTIIKITISPTSAYQFFIRLFGLWGFIALAIATIMTPFLKEIGKTFGKPFLKMHHLFGIGGLILITLHPVTLAIQRMNLAIFLPDFSSWYQFWLLGGRPALILLYIALIGVVLRKKIKVWRGIHTLMYLMLFIGYVHGILIGTDFQNVGIVIIFSLLMAASIGALILKRIQLHQLAKKRNTNAQKKNN
jgi:DMSO/TMAO reductase YedYZ heme-binding membrane subunit